MELFLKIDFINEENVFILPIYKNVSTARKHEKSTIPYRALDSSDEQNTVKQSTPEIGPNRRKPRAITTFFHADVTFSRAFICVCMIVEAP